MTARRYRQLALRLFAALGVFFVTGELLGRALNIVDRLNGYTRLVYTQGPSLDLPYLLRPGIEASIFNTSVRVNRLGLRGPDFPDEPSPGVRRVVMLGDSVVFGLGLAEEETVTAMLARDLNRTGGSSYEVINAGVPGYDTVAEVRLLESYGLRLKPHVIVVGTSLNDYDVTPVLSPLGILARRDLGDREPALLDRSEFLVLLRWLMAHARGNLWYQAPARLQTPREQESDDPGTRLARLVQMEHLRFYRKPRPAYWNRLRRAFQELAELANAHGVDLLVAIFPENYQVGVHGGDLTPQRRLLEVCRETRIRCLDLQPAFEAAGGDLFADIQHPNARGHAVAAAAIAAELLDRSVPPDS